MTLADYNSLDVLYTTLAVCVALLTIFLVILLYRVIKTLGHVNTLVAKVEELTEMIQHYVTMPLQLIRQFMGVMEKVKERWPRRRAKH